MLLPSGFNVEKRTPIYDGSHFTWGEATKNLSRPIEDLVIDGKFIQSTYDIEASIIRTAKSLDAIRSLLGNRPIHINSWYRPVKVNVAVGGSKYSRHQYGDAVDIRSNYYSPQQIYKVLHSVHIGGIGRYYNFIHIDWRGSKARWYA
ncbi:D-Ala-D-Ala carboxypeptidase family metallohydrolase [Myxosarcina sp. GI1]|uniref:YcbK family protein n=1 Tax=Myxosarcina sp. GI1 TaxID=1541065 RepID=UPI00055C0FA7|nr:D-Ala-D-Ala carboxypeptidase family metallohydrolase [Myxosarcina sp. GI1]